MAASSTTSPFSGTVEALATKPNLATERKAYHHEPLPDPSTYIRLLELEDPHDWDRTGMRCRLTTWPRDGAPEYHAASYTWGDPTPVCQLLIDQTSIGISRNAEEVLKQLAHFATCRYYWIDCLCIDQRNVEEKNGQVAIMGDIFRRAGHTLACLGWEDDGAEEAMCMIAEVEEGHSYTLNRLAHDSRIGYSLLMKEGRTQLPHLHNRLQNRLPGFITKLVALSHRPYFSRMWIVQEVLLSSSISICCGQTRSAAAVVKHYLTLAMLVHKLPTEIYHATEPHLMVLLQSAAGMPPADRLRRVNYLAINVLNHRVRAEVDMHGSSKSKGGSVRYDPCTAIQLSLHRSCADPRDAVYSLLAFIDWGKSEPLRPDYNISLLHLASDVLHRGPRKATFDSAYRVVTSLRLDVDEASVRDAIQSRQKVLGNYSCSAPQNSYSRALPQVSVRSSGMEVSDDVCRLLKPGHDTPLPGSSEHVTFTDIQPGDRITLAFGVSTKKDCGFVLRPDGDVFHIVGRVRYSGTGWPGGHWRDIEFLFDPEDFIVNDCIERRLACSEKRAFVESEPLRALFLTPVCRHPVSSYARLR